MARQARLDLPAVHVQLGLPVKREIEKRGRMFGGITNIMRAAALGFLRLPLEDQAKLIEQLAAFDENGGEEVYPRSLRRDRHAG